MPDTSCVVPEETQQVVKEEPTAMGALVQGIVVMVLGTVAQAAVGAGSNALARWATKPRTFPQKVASVVSQVIVRPEVNMLVQAGVAKGVQNAGNKFPSVQKKITERVMQILNTPPQLP